MSKLHEAISNAGLVYERVRFRLTGQARRVLSRKNLEGSVNYPFFQRFVTIVKQYPIPISLYYQSMFDENGNKIIQTKNECRLLASEASVHYYSTYVSGMKLRHDTYENFIRSVSSTATILDNFIADNNIDGTLKPSDLINIDVLGRGTPEWLFMLQTGIISPAILFSSDRALKFGRYINDREEFTLAYQMVRDHDTDGGLKKIIRHRFEKYFEGIVDD